MYWARELLPRLGPGILAAMGVAVKLIPVVVDGIQHAQALPKATGQEKKAHVLGLVRDAVGVYNTTGKGPALDPEQTEAVVGQGIDATVDALKLIQAKKAA